MKLSTTLSTFTYSGHGVNIEPGAAISIYTGHVEGFVEDQNGVDSYSAFYAQYGDVGMSVSVPLGYSVGVGAGVVHFYTNPSEKYPGLYGNIFYVSGGIEGIDFGRWESWYWQAGDAKSYVDANCRVKMFELEQDIYNGDASPLNPWAHGFRRVWDGRNTGIRNARIRAEAFNLRHAGNSCSCRPK